MHSTDLVDMETVQLYCVLAILTITTSFAFGETLSPSSYKTGDFVISYDPSSLPNIKVYQDEILVWYTSPSQSYFISAARVDENYTQISGNFIFNNSQVDVCTDATITKTGIKPSPSSNQIVYIQGSLCQKVSFGIYFQAVQVEDGNTKFSHLTFRVEMTMNDYNQIRLTYGCENDEQFYGFGAQYSKFNMKGTRLPVFLSEQGVGRGLEPFTSALNKISPGAGKHDRHARAVQQYRPIIIMYHR